MYKRRLLIVLLAGVAGLAGFDIVREVEVESSRRALVDQSLAMMRGEAVSTCAYGPGRAREPRAIVNRSLYLARCAERQPMLRRETLLRRARSAVRRAAARRPHWAEAAVVAAYIDELETDDAARARSRASLVASYRWAPYLVEAGPWRIRAALPHWPDLSAVERSDVIEEALFLIRVKPMLMPALVAQFRQSPAYTPFMLRYRDVVARYMFRP